MFRRFLAFLIVLTSSSFLLTYLGAQSVSNNTPATAITMSISPPTITLQTGTSQNFSVTLLNDFLAEGAEITLSGAGCSGATCGITTPGVMLSGQTVTIALSAQAFTYTAPASVPSNPIVTLTATSVQSPTISITSTITLQPTPPPVQPVNVTALTSQTSTTTNIFALPATTSGNDIGVAVSALTTDTISSVQACVTIPTNCTTATTAVTTGTNSTASIKVALYYFLGVPAGVTSILVNNSVPAGTVAVAYADCSNCGVFDTSNNTNNSSGINPTGSSLTTTTSGDFVMSFVVTQGTVSAVSTPYALAQGSAGFGFAEATLVQTAAGATAASYTATTGQWAAASMAFKPASNSGAPISVSISPTAPTVQTSATQSFTASVANDTANAGVNVTYTGTGCSGGTCGTGPSTAVSGTPFTYTAPSSVPGGGGSAITLVQHGSSTCNLSSGSGSIKVNNFYDLSSSITATTTLTGFTTTGNLLLLTIFFPSAQSVSSMTDSAGDSWSSRATSTDTPSGGDSTQVLSTSTSTAAISGVTQLNLTVSSPFGYAVIYLYDLTVSPATGWTFTTSSVTGTAGTSTTNPVGPNITPAGSGLVASVIAPANGHANSVASPWTFLDVYNDGVNAYLLNTGTAQVGPSWTLGSAATWSGNSISIVPSGGGGGTCSVSIASSHGGTNDLLCGLASWKTPSTGTGTVTDNKSGGSQTYTGVSGISAPDYVHQCVYGGAAGITQLNFGITSNPAAVDVYYDEWTGISSGTPDQTASNNSIASGTSCPSGATATTTNAADLLFGFCKNSSASSFTAGTDGQSQNYVLLDQKFANGSATQEFYPTTATAAYSSTMTANAAGTGEAFVEAWKGAAGGGGSTPVVVTVTSVTDPTKSAQAVVTIQTAAAPISVAISPTSASVQVSKTQPFTATNTNDAGSNTDTWTVTCPAGSGAVCGLVSPTTTSSGSATTYTAPATVPSPATVTIKATDVTDSTKSASANITVTNPAGPTVVIMPTGGDDTSNVQNTINSTAAASQTVELSPNGGNTTFLVHAGRISIPSSAKILLNGVTVTDQSGDNGGGNADDVMFLSSGSNWSFTTTGSGGTIEMPNSWAYSVGNPTACSGDDCEYGHCINIGTGSGITISGITLFKCAGDGVYFTGTSNDTVSGMIVNTVYRNGMSNTGKTDHVTVSNTTIENGLRACFDFEPNNDGDFLTNQTISSLTCSSNAGGGISVGPYALTNATVPLSITISNYSSTGDSGDCMGFFNSMTGSPPSVGGTVTVTNPTCTNSGAEGMLFDWGSNGAAITITGANIVNPLVVGDPHYGGTSAVLIREDGGQTAPFVGNVTITGVNISTINSHMTDYFVLGNPGQHVNLTCGTCSGATNGSAVHSIVIP